MLDSDEVLSKDLSDDLADFMNHDHSKMSGAFNIQRNLIFMNRLLRFGRSSDRPIRLFETSSYRYSGDIHEKLVLVGTKHTPKSKRFAPDACMFHYSYENLEDYFQKFNRYTSMIAKQKCEEGARIPRFFSLRLPIDFLNRYILRGGFLDGQAGLCYAIISSFYAYTKYAKAYEIQLK